MKKFTFKNNIEFTLDTPSFDDYLRLEDLRGQETSTSKLFDELIKYITYPSKEEAIKILEKFKGGIHYLFSLWIKPDKDIVSKVIITDEDDDKIKLTFEDQVFYFRRPSFVEMDLFWSEFVKKTKVSSVLLLKLLNMFLIKSTDIIVGEKFKSLVEQYPYLVDHIGIQIMDRNFLSPGE